MDKIMNFSTLTDVKKELLILSEINTIKSKNWSPYKIFLHCSQTIEYSMVGYPILKSKFFRYTIGKLVIKKFLNQGFMKHNLSAPVPGGSNIEDSGTANEGIDTLIKSIDKFKAFNNELAPHLAFGKLSKDDYDKYFSFHIADHLSELEY
jgi:hypothetical protein